MTLRLILSGGIGCGKSAVAELLADRGAFAIEADRVGHAVLEPGGEAYLDVTEIWPEVVVDGLIDRRGLGRIVFSDRAELQKLESVTHPAIRSRILSMVAESHVPVVVVELPIPSNLLGEGWLRVIVDCPADERRNRLLARGMAADEIEDRMASQPSRDSWLALADHVIDNSGDLDALRLSVDEFWDQVVRPRTAR